MARKKYVPYGLNIEQVNDRYSLGKSNNKKQSNLKTNWQIVSSNLFTFFNLILVLLAILLISIGSYKNLWFMVIAFINTAIGIFQEFRARSSVEKLSLITENKIIVIREGLFLEIDIESIVIDDLVIYKSGKQIVADSIIEHGELNVNEANITGESKSVIKKPGDSLFSGSFVISGEAYSKVIAVGDDNYIASLQNQAKTLKKPRSVILDTLKTVLKIIGIIIIPLGLMTFYNVFKGSGYDYLPDFIANQTMFELAVRKMAGAMVAMVPSGLVLLTTMTFSISVIKLSKKKTLVQEIYSIETLARVDTLCLDKTGTITDGTMNIDKFINLKGFTEKVYSNADIKDVITSMNYALKDNNQTAKALNNFFKKQEKFVAKKTVDFNSKNKYSICKFETGTFVIGAPEIIYRGQYKEIKKQVETYAKKGKRVLLLAEVDGIAKEKLTGQPRGVALIIINDHIRKSAPSTIADFIEADVKIKVISGDNALTVSEVSRRAGVIDADKYISLDTVDDADLERVANEYNVFGRVTPEQKKQLIIYLQADNHKVCMIGDGVNDILALKQADVSVSLASASDATRNISHIVLLDDDFCSLPQVVKEGRQIVCNMEKASVLYLVKTLYTILLTFILLLTSRIYPFEPIQMFVIETFIVGIPTFFLAIESNNKMFKGKFFKNVMKNVVPGALIIIANLLGVYIFSGAFYGLSDAEISTVGISAATFAYWLILTYSSFPLTKLKRIILISSFAVAGICFTLFSSLFMISPLSIPAVLLMLLLMESTYIVMAMFHGRIL
ncbi:HAD-IC family P-type ATPase [Mycoplasmatota bacterium WC30]